MSGRAFTRRLYAYTASKPGAGRLMPHHHIRVTSEIRSDLSMWLTFLNSPEVYSRPFIDFSSVLSVRILNWYTDASKNHKLGFGGIFDGRYFWNTWENSKYPCKRSNRGLYTNFIKEKDPSIEYLELYAVVASFLMWSKFVCNMRICLFTDNDSVKNMINHTTSSCKNCMVLIRILTLESLRCNTWVYSRHVRSKDNFLADSLSRLKFKEFLADVHKYKITLIEPPEAMPEAIWPIQKIWVN